MENGKKTAVAFVDFRAAFDSVRHDFLVRAMASVGIPRRTTALVMECFREAAVRIRVRGSDGLTHRGLPLRLDGVFSKETSFTSAVLRCPAPAPPTRGDLRGGTPTVDAGWRVTGDADVGVCRRPRNTGGGNNQGGSGGANYGETDASREDC